MTRNLEETTQSPYQVADHWACAHGPTLSNGVLRQELSDFQVVEQLGYEPSGEGDHQWLLIEKHDTNTEWVARQLAKVLGRRQVDIGFAGLKDKRGITQQWFSVDLSGQPEPDWRVLESQLDSNIQVLKTTWHRKKLRRGGLQGNRFEIVVRHGKIGAEQLAQRVAQIEKLGVPNYFGMQRFGRDGMNVVKAVRELPRRKVLRDRHKRGMYISAARAFLFNKVLHRRVLDGSWNALLPGEVIMLNGSNSVFRADASDETLTTRLEQFDIHPTGPLYGEGEAMVSGDVLSLEKSNESEYGELCKALGGIRQLYRERRSLRLAVPRIGVESLDEGTRFSFELPKGAYATSVLREIFALSNAEYGRRESAA